MFFSTMEVWGSLKLPLWFMMVYASNVGSTAGSSLLNSYPPMTGLMSATSSNMQWPLMLTYSNTMTDIDGHVHTAGDSLAPENQNRAAKAGTGSRRLTGTCIFAKKRPCHFRFRILRRFEHNTSPPYPSWTST